VGKYLGFADLDSSLAARSVGGLSVGQAQRVALARTLANEPEVGLAFSKFGNACLNQHYFVAEDENFVIFFSLNLVMVM